MEPNARSDEHLDDGMVQLEVNLDDTPGEWLGWVMERLLESGANDVWYAPIYMKKNRPAVQLSVMCAAARVDAVKEILFRETTTLGVRSYPLTVHRLARRYRAVKTPWGDVTVKEGLYRGEVVQRAPEYEECRAIAKRAGVPIKVVYQTIWRELEV